MAVSVSAMALVFAAPAHAEGWSGPWVSVGVSGSSSSANVTSTVNGSLTKDVSTYYPYTLTGSPSIDATEYVLDASSGAEGKANTGFRAGTVLEAGYDHEFNGGFVLGLAASYNITGDATSNDVFGTGNLDVTGQDGSYAWTGTAPAGTNLGTSALYDLSGGTFTPTPETSPSSLYHGGVVSSARFRMGDNWSIGARAGYAVNSNVLLFVAGGLTEAKIGIAADSTAINPDFSTLGSLKTVSGSKWSTGYYLGGGVEAKLTQKISVKAEYRYSDYGSYSVSSTESVPVGAADFGLAVPFTTKVSATGIQSHALRVSIGYHF